MKSKDRVRFDSLSPYGGVIGTRERDGNSGLVSLLPAPDGTPIPEGGELVHVGANDSEGWRNVEVLYRNGPAQVATPAYREGYDRIFGKKQKAGLA